VEQPVTQHAAISPGPELLAAFETPHGLVSLYARCPSGFFGELRLDSGIGDFADYSSIIQTLDEFEKIASGKDGRVTLALLEQTVIVGYFACWYPKPGERWSKLGELMYEMGAIEVSRNYRNLGLARQLVQTILSEPFIEDKIAYMNGYSWHWDVDGSGFPVSQYRTVHLKLLEPYCFQEFRTNEPNISLREENIFMARIGSRVSPEDQKRFRHLTFGR
jgi:acetoin utilization protein AcuA